MLVAIGAPACWTAPAPAPAPPIVVEAAPPRAPTTFDARRCKPDTVVEGGCGTTNRGSCPARASSVEIIDTDLPVSRDLESYRDFSFDRNRTRRYRKDNGADEDGAEVGTICCYSRCTELVVAEASPPTKVPIGQIPQVRCIPAPATGTRFPHASNSACPAAVELDGTMRPYETSRGGTCCYRSSVSFQIKGGRALRIDGEAAIAPVDGLAGWRAGTLAPALDMLPDIRARLAQTWLDAARAEHASVAAFSVLALRLLALGAPPALIARTHAAALDEIEHARLAFGLASAYAGVPVGPAAFSEVARATTSCDLATLAIETLLDGCIAETAAALEAEVAAERAADPVVAGVLATIAEDEARHAELAFAILGWCVAREPALRAALERALAAVVHVEPADDGLLDGRTAVTLRAEVVRDVVAPCLSALAA